MPAGIETGTHLRLTGEGEPGSNGGPPGDLYVSIRVKDHPIFTRQDDNLLYETSVNVAQAALGVTVTIPTLEGEDNLEIPAGTHSGRIFRLKGRGIVNLGRSRRGDQIVTVLVKTPQKLNEEQRLLFEALGKSLSGDGLPSDKGGGKGWSRKIRDAFGTED